MKQKNLGLIFITFLTASLFFYFSPKKESQTLTTVKPVPMLNEKTPSVLNKTFSKTLPQKLKLGSSKNNKISETQLDAQLISRCLDQEVQPHFDLKKLAAQKGWLDPRTNKVVKKNFIFKSNEQEKRLHIVPGENTKYWSARLFSVDNEGLPVPLKKDQISDISKAKTTFSHELKGMSQTVEETLLEINGPGHSGSLLLANQNIEKLVVFNKKSKKILECFSNDCHCGQY